jgi:hypothetical protein
MSRGSRSPSYRRKMPGSRFFSSERCRLLLAHSRVWLRLSNVREFTWVSGMTVMSCGSGERRAEYPFCVLCSR